MPSALSSFVTRNDIMTNPLHDRSTLFQLTGDLARDSADVLRAHVSLLKAEVHETIDRTKITYSIYTAGGFLAAAGLMFVLVAVVRVMQDQFQMSPWIAWGSIGVIMIVAGLISLMIAQRRYSELRFVPERTIQSLQESMTWPR
jgi:uncharacterized membrane protein YcjF (UPF0283 family)